jgi:uncharacterized membrane protein
MGKRMMEEVACISAGETKKTMFKWTVLVVIALLAGVGAVFAFNVPGPGKGEKVKPVNGSISIPVAKVLDDKAHFYKFTNGGQEIGFFLVKGGDGAIHSAFDACDVCYKEKRGYIQEGDFMICRNCNKKFAIVRIGPHASGGCNPSSLPHQLAADNIVISVNELKAGGRFF